MPKLQWGRGLTSAEITESLVFWHNAVFASMGPRTYIRGNSGRKRRLPIVIEELQWGRGLTSAEICRRYSAASSTFLGFNGAADLHPRKYPVLRTSRTDTRLLQWGRGLTSAEITVNDHWLVFHMLLQWGRGLTSAEILLIRIKSVPAGAASMGPRTYIRGNAGANGDCQSSSKRLQWGRGLTSAEIADP